MSKKLTNTRIITIVDSKNLDTSSIKKKQIGLSTYGYSRGLGQIKWKAGKRNTTDAPETPN